MRIAHFLAEAHKGNFLPLQKDANGADWETRLPESPTNISGRAPCLNSMHDLCLEFYRPDPVSAQLLQLCCFLVTLQTVQRERPSTCNRQRVQMNLALLPAVDAMEIFKQPDYLITAKIPQNKHRRLVQHTMTCASAKLDITWNRATAAEMLHGFRVLTCASERKVASSIQPIHPAFP